MRINYGIGTVNKNGGRVNNNVDTFGRKWKNYIYFHIFLRCLRFGNDFSYNIATYFLKRKLHKPVPFRTCESWSDVK